ncbi:MAG: hypothetical protein E7616_07480 [Ruminococcaceae bacterium]|nr:hypothetical protein [Oscillospiraceae bacterium]
MKRNKMKRLTAILLSVLILFSINTVPVLANSAQSYWNGVDQSGTIIADGDSPIIVEKELLTFDLQEFPKNYYHEIDEFLAYSGKVTAEYTFYNPSDITVTAKLLFPFGCDAQYADFYDYENNVRLDNVDTEKYDILINGEVVEKKIRHTLSSYSRQFVLDKDLGLISDSFIEDSFYVPELTVTKYVFKIDGVDTEKYKAADVGFDVPKGLGSYRIYFPEQNGAHTQKDGDMRIHTCVQKNEREFNLYVFGTPFTTMPEWKAYQNGGVEDSEAIAGRVELVGTEKLSFKDFVLANWFEQSGVLNVDWYNAAVSELKDSLQHSPDYPIVDLYRHSRGFEGSLMRWYEYEITIEARERIVNTVTAPIYPSIDLRYEPDVFGYTYLLSPAKTWKSFGELEIVINTPYYISNCSIGGFIKTESGYIVKLDGLPNGELTFHLSTSENPIRPMPPYDYTGWVVIGIVFLLGSGIIAFALVRKNKRRGVIG